MFRALASPKVRLFRHLLLCLGLALVLGSVSGSAQATSPQGDDCSTSGTSCQVDNLEPPGTSHGSGDADADALLFFWGVGCSHCTEAKPFLSALPKEFPGLRVERIEVRRSAAGRRRFVDKVRELGIQGAGIPTFVFARRYIVGFTPGVTEEKIRSLLRRDGSGPRDIEGGASVIDSLVLPLIGTIEPGRLSMPVLTLIVGLVEGINPCATWVLLALLGILMHVRSRRRLLLAGGLFVLMSGTVYFLFMTAWVRLFSLTGISSAVTICIGAVVLTMGLINLKELVAFKRGPSLAIPKLAKPHILRRMRRVASLPAAVVGVIVLALFVNLVELGCTFGLPAVYTRVLTLRGYSSAERYAYLVLYNATYVVPLALIVGVYAVTMHRLTFSVRSCSKGSAVSSWSASGSYS